MKELKPFDYKALHQLDIYLDFIAPVNKEEKKETLEYLFKIEEELKKDCSLTTE